MCPAGLPCGPPANELMAIQAVVAPGGGAVAAQVGVDPTRANQLLVYDVPNENIQPGEAVDPVATLRVRYDSWKPVA